MVRMSTCASRRSPIAAAHLVGTLAHPQDQVGLRDHVGAVALGEPEHVERAVVAERRPDTVVEPSHRLEVVGEHVGSGVQQRRDVVLPALEVARQHLHADAGHGLLHAPDGLRPQGRTAVVEVVPRDARSRRRGASPSRPPRRAILAGSSRSIGIGLGGHHVAEPAASGALRTQDQEGRLAFLPALRDVGAHRLFADRVEREAPHQALQLRVVRTAREPHLQPRRFARTRRC